MAFAILPSLLAAPTRQLQPQSASTPGSWTGQSCGPGPGHFWLVGSHHKTGTELGDQLLTNLGWHGTFKTTGFNMGKDPLVAGCRGLTDREYRPPDNNFFLDARCLNATDEAGKEGAVLRVRHMMTTTPTWHKQLAAFKLAAKGTGRAEWADGGQIRTIMFQRDPLEVIKSAYFYDARGGENDPKRIPNPWLASVTEVACGAEKSTAEGLCEALKAFPEKTTSWEFALRQLPPRLGVVAEALNELGGLKDMRASVEALQATPDEAMLVDLSELMRDFDRGVEKLLRFLGVDEAHRHSCVLRCRASDITRTRSDDGLATCLKGKPAVQRTLDELRAKLEPRAPANDTAASSSTSASDAKLEVIDQPGWYNKYVTPIEKATPNECAGSDHEFEPALESLKEQLDGVLRASHFFKQRVAPLRRAMGYHD